MIFLVHESQKTWFDLGLRGGALSSSWVLQNGWYEFPESWVPSWVPLSPPESLVESLAEFPEFSMSSPESSPSPSLSASPGEICTCYFCNVFSFCSIFSIIFFYLSSVNFLKFYYFLSPSTWVPWVPNLAFLLSSPGRLPSDIISVHSCHLVGCL